MLHGEERISVSSLPSSIAPAKLAVCAVFRCFALQLQKAISFQRLADLGEFYVKSKGFPCSTWKSSDFGRMDEKRGGLSSSCGAFSGLKIPEWHRPEHGVRGSDRTEVRMHMLSSFGRCYMAKNESPFKFTFVYRPRKVGCLCCFSLFCPPTSKGHIFSTASADLGEFYVKSKGFPCSTWKLSDFGRMDEKRGGLSSSCGAFSGLKIPEWHCP